MEESYFSLYGPLIEKYFEYKRSLGFKFHEEYPFHELDRFLENEGGQTIGLTRTLCEKYTQKRKNESTSTAYQRSNRLRNFSVFLNLLGYPSYIPAQQKDYQTAFTPHIFTHDELSRFFAACDSMPISNYYASERHVFPALFRLLYGCGLRKSEALALQCRNIDLAAKTIFIFVSKNCEERILPISESLAKILADYARLYGKDNKTNTPFFTRRDGRPCSGDTVYRVFREVLFRAKVPHGGKAKGPRVHDFRHTFAVHSMAQMSDAGLDLYYSLPILSKYLGHNSLDATEKYVRMTAEMYPGIFEDVNQLCAYVFPEVYKYEAH